METVIIDRSSRGSSQLWSTTINNVSYKADRLRERWLILLIQFGRLNELKQLNSFTDWWFTRFNCIIEKLNLIKFEFYRQNHYKSCNSTINVECFIVLNQLNWPIITTFKLISGIFVLNIFMNISELATNKSITGNGICEDLLSSHLCCNKTSAKLKDLLWCQGDKRLCTIYPQV